MNKNIGFRRNIYRSWLDAAAMLAAETDDSAQLRAQLGPVDKAVERVIFSLRDWSILAPAAKRYTYSPRRQAFRTEQKELQLWLLSAALLAHPAEELPFSELIRLPELFPFRLTIGVQ